MRSRVGISIMVVIALVCITAGRVQARDGSNARKARATQQQGGMTLAQSIVLGLVEGVTEYLPVSSTGHLLLAQRAMGIGGHTALPPEEKQRAKTAADAYAICIQAGAILAVLGLYARRVKQMLMGLAGKSPDGLQLALNIFSAFVPAAVLGLIFADFIKAYLFGPWPIIVAWFVGGVAILAVGWWNKARGHNPITGKNLGQLTWQMSFGVGLAQCIAMWPGVSRSLVTIVGGMLVGLALPAAVEFSFLLGLVTLGAATCYDGLRHGQVMLMTFEPVALGAGLMVAFISAAIAVKWMVAYLNRHGLEIFGYYRIILSVMAAWLIFARVF